MLMKPLLNVLRIDWSNMISKEELLEIMLDLSYRGHTFESVALQVSERINTLLEERIEVRLVNARLDGYSKGYENGKNDSTNSLGFSTLTKEVVLEEVKASAYIEGYEDALRFGTKGEGHEDK